MYSCTQLLQALEDGSLDRRLAPVYAPDGTGLDQARTRALRVTNSLL